VIPEARRAPSEKLLDRFSAHPLSPAEQDRFYAIAAVFARFARYVEEATPDERLRKRALEQLELVLDSVRRGIASD
jgi:hypothetical protein